MSEASTTASSMSQVPKSQLDTTRINAYIWIGATYEGGADDV
jgi:hypothetical protein